MGCLPESIKYARGTVYILGESNARYTLEQLNEYADQQTSAMIPLNSRQNLCKPTVPHVTPCSKICLKELNAYLSYVCQNSFIFTITRLSSLTSR